MSSVTLTVCRDASALPGTQEEMLRYLAGTCACGSDDVGEALAEAALAREESVSTLLGDGLAVPHARTGLIDRIAISAAYVPGGMDWPGEGARAELVLFLGVPRALVTDYLALIRHIILWYKHLPATERAAVLGDPETLRRELQQVIDR